jgi:16S rRNA (adenine1518-N6/adenine1519-N6)-dimethyltransferase
MILRKQLGQHLLIDRGALKKEAQLISCDGKTVLEIGPGDGRLTRGVLVAGAAHITAVEKDRLMVSALNRQFHANRKVTVVHGDFLEFAPGAYDRIIGNIPYYISSQIIFRLLEFEFGYCILCVQKEFASRLLAKPGGRNYGRLSASAGHYFEIEKLLDVPRVSFAPIPRVDSTVIGLRKRNVGRDLRFERISNALFQHRLKTVRAALAASHTALGMEKRDAKKLGDSVKYKERRVFTLSAQEIIEIAGQVG